MPGEDAFATPQAKKFCKDGASFSTTPGRSLTTFEIPPSPCLKRLGFGTGVNVMLYERSPQNNIIRSPWAIKKLNKRISVKSEYAKRLEEEAEILRKLQHPNIIGYRGFKRSEDGSAILMIENGQRSLSDILIDRNKGIEQKSWFLDPKNESDEEESLIEETPHPLAAEDILKVIRALAGALDYLHTSTLGGKPKLLHGDLKSANVLVKGEFDEIKLCDFGVTLPLNDAGEVNQEGGKNQYIGTEPWSAKEVIEEETISTKTDIYALGCTIFEMLSLETPHFNKMGDIDDDNDDSIDDTEYQNALGTRPDLPDYLDDFLQDDAYEKILGIYYACTSENPSNRPSASDILDILDSEDIWEDTSEAWNFLLMEYEKEKSLEYPLEFDEIQNKEIQFIEDPDDINSEVCNSNCCHSDDSVFELLSNQDSVDSAESKDLSVIEISDDELKSIKLVQQTSSTCSKDQLNSNEPASDLECSSTKSDEVPQVSKKSALENAEDEVNKWLEATLNLSKDVSCESQIYNGCREKEQFSDNSNIKVEKDAKNNTLEVNEDIESDNERTDDQIDVDSTNDSQRQKTTDKDEVNKWLEQTFNLSNNRANVSLNCEIGSIDSLCANIKAEKEDDTDECSNEHESDEFSNEESEFEDSKQIVSNLNLEEIKSVQDSSEIADSNALCKKESEDVNEWLKRTIGSKQSLL